MGMNFAGLNESALRHIIDVLNSVLPGGEIVGNEYRCADLTGGKGRSFGVNLSTGVWSDFSTGQKGGDLIALVAESRRIKMGEAYTFLADKLGYTNGNGAGSGHQQPVNQSKPVEKLSPPPLDVAPPKFQGVHWTYRDFDGRPMFFVERVDIGDNKQFFPMSWSESAGGWVKRAWPSKRPLYGLELLAARPDAPVLIVEGEKCADAARSLFKSYVVVTWQGGSQAIAKTDWTPLYTRKKILMWPDADRKVIKLEGESKQFGLPIGAIKPYADQPGIRAMAEIASILVVHGHELKIIDVGIDEGRLDGWDAADAVAEGWDAAKVVAWAKPRAKIFTPPSVASPEPPKDDTPMPTEREAPQLNGPERFKKSSRDTASQWPGPHGFYDIVENEKTGAVRFVPMYNELAKWVFANKNMCFNDKDQLKYDGKKWNKLDDIEFHSLIVEWNKGHSQPAHLDNFAKQTRAVCFTGALGINPDSAVGHLNVENGVVKISDGTLGPHDYRFRFKYCSPIVYDPNADCPRWEQFLFETFEKDLELMDLAQRLFGYVLMGGRPFLHKAFVLYGSGRNGKSTFLDVLRAVIGRDAYSTVSMGKLDKEFSLVNLEGKLANVVEETPNEAINAEVFKTLVGGGEVTVARKGFDEYQLRCDARFVFACNDMPVFKDKSVGLEDRLIFMPFNRYIPEEERDTMILDKLFAELPGILNWALAGAKTMSSTRMIPKYDILGTSKEDYRRSTNNLYAWFLDELEVVGGQSLTVADAYKRYCEDMREDNNHPVAKIRFAKEIRKEIKEVCRKSGVFYDPNLKSGDRTARLLSSVKFKQDRDSRDGRFSNQSRQMSWNNN